MKKGTLVHYVRVAIALKTNAKQDGCLEMTFASDAIFRSRGISFFFFVTVPRITFLSKMSIFLPFTFFAFLSPEAAILLVSDGDSDLWLGPTPKVRDSRTYRHSAHAQSQVRQI